MIKNTLNNKLFNDNKQLKPEVLEGLRKIVNRFTTELKEEHIPLDVLDYWLVGSNASFNYKPTSDIDVHLIADLSKVSKDPGVLQILYNYFKSVFNSKYDITCKGLPVELYVEDVVANQGPTLKRIRPRAQGRAYRINKRTAHISIYLNER